MAHDIEVHVNRMGLSGGTLIVVAIGNEVHGGWHAVLMPGET